MCWTMSSINLEKLPKPLSARDKFWETIGNSVEEWIRQRGPEELEPDAMDIADDVVSGLSDDLIDSIVEEEAHRTEVVELLEAIKLRSFSKLEVTEQRDLERLLETMRQ